MLEKKEVFTALVNLQRDIQSIKKNRVGRFKYADYDAIMDAMRPALVANKLALVHCIEIDQSIGTYLHTQLVHVSGQSVESRTPLRAFDLKDKFDNQEAGKNLTYLKRYVTMALLNITVEDDPNDNDGGSSRDSSNTISSPQVKLILARTKGNKEMIKSILEKLGLHELSQIPRDKFNQLLVYIEKLQERINGKNDQT